MFNKSRALWLRGSLALAGVAAAYDLPVAIVEPGKAFVLHGDTRTDPEDLNPKFRPGDRISVSWGFYLSELGKVPHAWLNAGLRIGIQLFKTRFSSVSSLNRVLLGIRQRTESMI